MLFLVKRSSVRPTVGVTGGWIDIFHLGRLHSRSNMEHTAVQTFCGFQRPGFLVRRIRRGEPRGITESLRHPQYMHELKACGGAPETPALSLHGQQRLPTKSTVSTASKRCRNEANRDQKAPQVASQLNLHALVVVTLRSQSGSPLEATFLHGRNLLLPPVSGARQVGVETSICSFVAVLEGSSSFAQQEKAFFARSLVGGVVCLCILQRERDLAWIVCQKHRSKGCAVVGEPPGCAWSVAYRRTWRVTVGNSDFLSKLRLERRRCTDSVATAVSVQDRCPEHLCQATAT